MRKNHVYWTAVVMTIILGAGAIVGSILIGITGGLETWTKFTNVFFGTTGAALLASSGVFATLAVKHEQSLADEGMEMRLCNHVTNCSAKGDEW